MAEDGSQTEVNIDPNGPAYEQRVAGQPASEEQVKQAQADPNLRDQIETIFNPNVGKYDVEADIGPAFNTRRQEGFAAMTEIAKQNPNFMAIGGDLYFKQADFPLADELAERFKRSIPPAILGEGEPPMVQQIKDQAGIAAEGIPGGNGQDASAVRRRSRGVQAGRAAAHLGSARHADYSAHGRPCIG
jgi:hypothetical protein